MGMRSERKREEEEVISSIFQLKKEEEEEEKQKEKEKEEEDMAFIEYQEIDALRFTIVKEYLICMPPNNDLDQLHMIGAIRSLTYLEPFQDLGLTHGFIFFNNRRKARPFQHINVDGTPTFAGYVFGEMEKFTNFLTEGGTQEDLRKLLDAEVARNKLNFTSKV